MRRSVARRARARRNGRNCRAGAASRRFPAAGCRRSASPTGRRGNTCSPRPSRRLGRGRRSPRESGSWAMVPSPLTAVFEFRQVPSWKQWTGPATCHISPDFFVIPAQAGIRVADARWPWVPAFAGTTKEVSTVGTAGDDARSEMAARQPRRVRSRPRASWVSSGVFRNRGNGSTTGGRPRRKPNNTRQNVIGFQQGDRRT